MQNNNKSEELNIDSLGVTGDSMVFEGESAPIEFDFTSDDVGVTFESGADISVDEMSFDLGIDEELDGESLSDAALLEVGVNIVQTLSGYETSAFDALVNASPRNATVKEDTYRINPADFPYMNTDVLRVLNSVIRDMALDDASYGNMSPEQLVETSLEILYSTAFWSPTLNSDSYAEKFLLWLQAFRKLAKVQPKEEIPEWASLLDLESIKFAVHVFRTNTEFFRLVDTLVEGRSISLDIRLSRDDFADLVDSYCVSRHLRVLRLQDCRDALLEYLGSEESRSALGLTRDEILEFSTGELLRRTLVYELNSRQFYPSGLSTKPNEIAASLFSALDRAKTDSVAAEMLVMILRCVATIEQAAPKDAEVSYADAVRSLFNYLYAYIDSPAILNPVFYSHVKSEESGGYSLSYAWENNTNSVHSKDILCDVVGNKNAVFRIPRVVVDKKHCAVVCPPPGLMSSLRQVKLVGRIDVRGAVKFRFNPTSSWLIANQVLVEDTPADDQIDAHNLRSKADPIIQMLIGYDNDFDNGIEDSSVLAVVKLKDYLVYGVRSDAADNSFKVCLVKDSNGNVIGSDGTLVYDDSDGSVFATVYTFDHNVLDLAASASEYSEEHLGLVEEDHMGELSMEDMINYSPGVNSPEYKEYRQAVAGLCDVAALSYDAELSEVQKTIARDLFYVIRVPAIDELLASRLFESHMNYVNEGGKMSPFNFASVKELCDIILSAENNPLGKEAKWTPEVAALANSLSDKMRYTTADLCAQLDSLDFDVLALQALSQSELQETRGKWEGLLLYLALHHIPEVHARLCLLEDRMVLLRVCKTLGEDCKSIFSKKSFLSKAYSAYISADNVEVVASELRKDAKLQRSERDVLGLTRKVLRSKHCAEDILRKYFILERNMFGLLTAFQSASSPEASAIETCRLGLGLPDDFEVVGMTASEFSARVSAENVVRCCNENKELLLDFVYRGLCAEAMLNTGLSVIRTYDLFNCCYEQLVFNVGGKSYSEDLSVYENAFFDYAGSMIVSYCTILESAASMIDSGVSYVRMFVEEPEEFIFDVDIKTLRKRQLDDIRMMGEEEQ